MIPVQAAFAPEIIFLSTLLFFTSEMVAKQELWNHIATHVSVKAQQDITLGTFVVRDQVAKLGVNSKDVQLSENQGPKSKCAEEWPKAAAEAVRTAGKQPPAKQLDIKIKDEKYGGGDWAKWNYDYKANGVWIQVHYMYNSSTRQVDQVKQKFCKEPYP